MWLRPLLILLPSVVWAINYKCQNDQVLVVQSFGNDTIRMHCQRLDLCGYQKLRCDYDEHQPQCGGLMNFVAHVHQGSATSPVEHTCCNLFNPRPPHMVTTHVGNDCFIYELPDGSSVAKPKDDQPDDSPLTVLKSAAEIPEHIDHVSGYRLRLFQLKNKSPPTLLVKGIERRLDGYRVTICRPRCTSVAQAGQERAAAAAQGGTGDDGAEWKVISWSSWTSSSWTTWANSVGAQGERTRTRTGELPASGGVADRAAGAAATAPAGAATGTATNNINVDVDANGNNNNNWSEGAAAGKVGAGGFDRPTVNGERPGYINITVHTAGEGGHGGAGQQPNINVSANAENHIHNHLPDGSGRSAAGNGGNGDGDDNATGRGGKKGGAGAGEGDSGDGNGPDGLKGGRGGKKGGDGAPETDINGGEDAEKVGREQRIGKKPGNGAGNELGDGGDGGEGNRGKDGGKGKSDKGSGNGAKGASGGGDRGSGAAAGNGGNGLEDNNGAGAGGSGAAAAAGNGAGGKKGAAGAQDRSSGKTGGDGTGDKDKDKKGGAGAGAGGPDGGAGAGGKEGDLRASAGDKEGTDAGAGDQNGPDGKNGGKGAGGTDGGQGAKGQKSGPDGAGKAAGKSGKAGKDGGNGDDADLLKGGKAGAAGSGGAGGAGGSGGEGAGGARGNGGEDGDLHAAKGDKDGADGVDAGNRPDGGSGAAGGAGGKDGGAGGKDGEKGVTGGAGKSAGEAGKGGAGGADGSGGKGEELRAGPDGVDAGKTASGGGEKEAGGKGTVAGGAAGPELPVDGDGEATWTEGGDENAGGAGKDKVNGTGIPLKQERQPGAGAGELAGAGGAATGPSGKTEEEAAKARLENGERDGGSDGEAKFEEEDNANKPKEGDAAGAGTAGAAGGAGATGAGGAIRTPDNRNLEAEAKTGDEPSGTAAEEAPARDSGAAQTGQTGTGTTGGGGSGEVHASASGTNAGDAPAASDSAASAPQADSPSPSAMLDAMKNMNCFPADALVTTVTGPKRMDEVQVGDFVLVPAAGNVLKYERVEMFYHREETTRAQFVVLMTQAGKRMSLTPLHLLPFGQCDEVVRSMNSSEGVTELLGGSRFAQQAKVGDCVLSIDEYGELVADKITKIGRQYSEGIYSPMTVEGSLLVDGVLASCFSQLESHSVHKTVFDFLMYFRSLFGYDGHVHHEQQAIPSFITYVHDLSHYVLPFAKY